MSLPPARVVPSAVFARNGSGRMEGGHSGLDWPLQADADNFGATIGDQAPAPISPAVPKETHPSPNHLYELGLTTAAMSYHTAAIESLRDCIAHAPDHARAWRKLAELLRLAREDIEAETAEAMAERASAAAEKWKDAADERDAARLERAEQKLREKLGAGSPEDTAAALRDHLVVHPLDAAAMRLLAGLERLGGDEITSLRLLERTLDICPDYPGARQDYAELLIARRATASAEAQTARLVAQEPRNPYYRHLHAHASFHTGNLDVTIEILVALLREDPAEKQYWLLYAQALHHIGRRDESVQAFRHCLNLQPGLGEAYWGLVDMKGSVVTEADIAVMRERLDEDELEPESRKFMLFAFAHALERRGDFAGSFAAFEEGVGLARTISGEQLRRRQPDNADRDADRFDHDVRIDRLKAVFSRKNLETRLVQPPVTPGADTPIFVVGLPRAGSTLTEQILASHSHVEGTRELPLIPDLARDLALSRLLVVPNAYPECILDLTSQQLATLGGRYLDRSHIYRKTARPCFVDKRPWNWLEIGLIHLILPQARIIDIRREPMAACFGMFKQLIQDFSQDLGTLGRYYNRYVSMMEHWESVLPGRIHFVQYERLVEDTDTEIRRMLDYCGLPFEESCLRFWETDRIVSTPSAGQVRRPIYRDSLQQWRNFEPWLGPLKDALNEPVEG